MSSYLSDNRDENIDLHHHEVYVVLDSGNVIEGTFRVTFDSGHGLQISQVNMAPQWSTTFNLGSENANIEDEKAKCQTWVQYTICNNIYFFTFAFAFGTCMVVLQLLSLLLLTFEPVNLYNYNGTDTTFILHNGFTDTGTVIRFISDNIDAHRGYGAAMLLAFSGSFMLLVCIMAKYIELMILFVTFAAAGGIGVVVFHGAQEWEHIGCAAAFIFFGVLSHFMACVTGPFRRHVFRDGLMIFITTACGAIFLTTFVIAHREDPARHAPTHRLERLWWTAGIFEYVLYISITFLNFLIPSRLLEHIAYYITNDLPYIILEHMHSKRV